MTTRKYLLPVLIFIVGFAGAQRADLLPVLDKYIGNAVKAYGIPSLSIGIVKDGNIVFNKSYGVLKNGDPRSAGDHSIYAIASLTKAFTTAALGMLVDEGKLNWSDRVIDHLPYFELADSYVTANMTIRDLCSHRCGLRTFDGDLLWYGTDYTREEIVRRIGQLPLRQNFREDFGYQNIMYITAGELIGKVSGRSWDQFIRERIFNKLGMKETHTSFSELDLNHNVTCPHINGKPIQHLSYDNSGATAAIHSNTTDLCKWITFWLNSGMVGTDTVLSRSSIREIQSQHTILTISSFDEKNGVHFKGYGLGWFLMDYRGVKVIHHGGGLPGYISKIALVPEKNLGLIVLTNDMSSLPSALMYKVIDLFTEEGVDGRDWAAEFLEYTKKYEAEKREKSAGRHGERIQGTKPSHELAGYRGRYIDKMYGRAQLALVKDKLHLTMVPTKELFTATLNHWQYDTFQFQFADPFLPEGFLTFELDSYGKVSGFTIDLPNEDFHFENLHFIKE